MNNNQFDKSLDNKIFNELNSYNNINSYSTSKHKIKNRNQLKNHNNNNDNIKIVRPCGFNKQQSSLLNCEAIPNINNTIRIDSVSDNSDWSDVETLDTNLDQNKINLNNEECNIKHKPKKLIVSTKTNNITSLFDLLFGISTPKNKNNNKFKQLDNNQSNMLSIKEFKQELSDDEELYFNKCSTQQKKDYINKYVYFKMLDTINVPLRFRILDSNMPDIIKSKVLNKFDEIQDIPPIGGERNKWNQWINGILKVPFGILKEYPFDINNTKEISLFLEKSRQTLNNSVYGHEECKDFIIQMISQFISNKNSQGNVIGIQGPPGNGKTSLIRDGVCKSLERPFTMISLGGLSDGSHLEGHNFTYEGSMWGRLVQILMDAKCMNPVIYFDELDKVSKTKHGEEIIGILTHLTDFSQNDEIYDKYFSGIPFDFSKCMFIFSFNDETKINSILRDRIHIIKTDKIDNEGKLIIAKDYIIKKLLYNVGLNDGDIIFTNDILIEILNQYTYKEEGVREFKRKLEMIILKFNYLRLIEPDNYIIPYKINKKFIDNTLNTLTHRKNIDNINLNSNIYI